MKKIIVYSTPTCAFCSFVKQFLDEKGLEHEEIDISLDEKEMEKIKKETGQIGVPVTLIANDYIVGFDKKKIEKALSDNGYI